MVSLPGSYRLKNLPYKTIKQTIPLSKKCEYSVQISIGLQKKPAFPIPKLLPEKCEVILAFDVLL